MASEKQHLSDSSKVGYEKSDLSIGKVFAYGIGGVIAVVAIIVFLIDFYTGYTEEVISDVVLRPESMEIRELRAREMEVLNSYKLLDEANGVYQIPIERALELVADEAYRQKK